MQRFSVALTIGCLFAVHAQAGGFTIPGQGARSISRGAAFVALADDLTALSNNPGGLSKLRGTRLMINYNMLYGPSSFTRSPSSLPEPVGADGQPLRFGDPLASVENSEDIFPLGISLYVSSDFGLEDWTFAFGIYGPNAFGKMDYGTSGGARYMLTKQDMLLAYYTLGAAYGQKNWGVGATFQWAHLPVSKFSLVIDGTTSSAASTVTPYYSALDLESNLDLSDAGAPTAQLGAWVRPIPQIEIGVSARVVPIYLEPKGDVTLNKLPGQDLANNPNATFTVDGGKATLPLTMPIIARAGIRYRHLSGEREVFDIELDYVYEGWSSVDAYSVDLEGSVTLLLNGPEGEGSPAPLSDIDLSKKWKDTHSVRLGGTWNAIEDSFSVSAGGFWESAAVPENYSHLDFPSFQRFGVGGGIRLTGYGLDFNLAYMHVFNETREVSETFGKVFQQRPLAPCPCEGMNGVPANAGKFESAYHQFTANIGLHFNEWF